MVILIIISPIYYHIRNHTTIYEKINVDDFSMQKGSSRMSLLYKNIVEDDFFIRKNNC